MESAHRDAVEAGKHEVMRALDAVANPLGLLAEMSDARTGQLIGNIPQALSHLAHINAAATLHHATANER